MWGGEQSTNYLSVAYIEAEATPAIAVLYADVLCPITGAYVWKVESRPRRRSRRSRPPLLSVPSSLVPPPPSSASKNPSRSDLSPRRKPGRRGAKGEPSDQAKAARYRPHRPQRP